MRNFNYPRKNPQIRASRFFIFLVSARLSHPVYSELSNRTQLNLGPNFHTRTDPSVRFGLEQSSCKYVICYKGYA